MTISFQCPKCKKRLTARDDQAGKAARCKCGHVLKIPQASTPPVKRPFASGASGTAAEGDLGNLLDTMAEYEEEAPVDEQAMKQRVAERAANSPSRESAKPSPGSTVGKKPLVLGLIAIGVVALLVLLGAVLLGGSSESEEGQGNSASAEGGSDTATSKDKANSKPIPLVYLVLTDGKTKLGPGMKASTVEAALGKPDGGGGGFLTFANWRSKGLKVGFAGDGRVALIYASAKDEPIMGYAMATGSAVQGTDGGVALGGSSADIVACYGPPDGDVGGQAGKERDICYKNRAEFFLRKDRITQIWVGYTGSARNDAISASAASSPAPRIDLIRGEGATGLSFGVSPEEAKRILGEPDTKAGGTRPDRPFYLIYYRSGFALEFRDDALVGIKAYAEDKASYRKPTLYSEFQGTLDGDIRIGATRDEVRVKYDRSISEYGAKSFGVGIRFEDNKAVWIEVKATE